MTDRFGSGDRYAWGPGEEPTFREREIPKILERVKPLRRILQPTADEEAALKTLQGAAKDRSLTKQGRARLAALKIVRQSFTDYVASSGDFSHGPEFARVLATLKPGESVPIPPELAERFSLALHTERGFEMLEKWMRA
ncbi:MAG: hypothetical protein Q8N53_09195, partial [Longimicrobiales bacterium]|nr:hypothetical protein [Longimicrobiales bacterium]